MGLPFGEGIQDSSGCSLDSCLNWLDLSSSTLPFMRKVTTHPHYLWAELLLRKIFSENSVLTGIDPMVSYFYCG